MKMTNPTPNLRKEESLRPRLLGSYVAKDEQSCGRIEAQGHSNGK